MPSHVEEVPRVVERADGCDQEETFVYVLRTAKRTMKWENIVMDALDNDKVVCIWPGHQFFMNQCGAALWCCLGGRPQTDCSQAVAGGNDEVGKNR